MTQITDTFALCVKPVYLSAVDIASKARVTLSSRRKDITVQDGAGSSKTFTCEGDAWQYAVSIYPKLVTTLAGSESVTNRACGLRAEMFLRLGESRVNDMLADVHAQIQDIYAQALRALDAVQVFKAVPIVTRVSPTKGLSWLEVRTKVQLPYVSAPLLLSVRCLPSPLEDQTWSVRLRMPALTNDVMFEVQARFDELVTNLGYQGITVKDIQNGSLFDL